MRRAGERGLEADVSSCMQLTPRAMPLHVEVRGASRARPLLFVHGFPLDGRMWLPAAERLADRFFCIVPDLRGYGRTPAIPSVSIADYADEVAALIPEYVGRGRKVVLVGLSMGGIVAFEFFRRHRPLLAGLVLTCTRANAESPEGVRRRREIAESVVRDGVRPLADSMIGAMVSARAEGGVRDAIYRMMLDQPAEGVAAGSCALAGRADSEPTLGAIDVPTLCIAGEDDTITPVALMESIHGRIPGSRFAVIPGCGHVPPMEAPEDFAAVTGAFASALRRV